MVSSLPVSLMLQVVYKVAESTEERVDEWVVQAKFERFKRSEAATRWWLDGLQPWEMDTVDCEGVIRNVSPNYDVAYFMIANDVTVVTRGSSSIATPSTLSQSFRRQRSFFRCYTSMLTIAI
ncbi:hypothetical protein M378DRAFT_166553 [Amanita muscaria Koide BX008]|uniref:Uncharacterized protein n=1 Tax=Amanita muscaria (strain Koide BX008) TaxID=946122 RepID=A0A0C2SFA8_AMAMK|nr:hypothetical protein M378DRAFT_166553 [Amanita muscaria Koide BX008]